MPPSRYDQSSPRAVFCRNHVLLPSYLTALMGTRGLGLLEPWFIPRLEPPAQHKPGGSSNLNSHEHELSLPIRIIIYHVGSLQRNVHCAKIISIQVCRQWRERREKYASVILELWKTDCPASIKALPCRLSPVVVVILLSVSSLPSFPISLPHPLSLQYCQTYSSLPSCFPLSLSHLYTFYR